MHSWNYKIIKQQEKIYLEAVKNNNDRLIAAELEQLKSIKTDSLSLYDKSGSFEEQMNDDIIALKENSSFIKDIKHFRNIGRSIPIKGFQEMNYIYMKEKFIFEFMRDFFYYISNDYGKIFDEISSNRRDNFRFSKSQSYSIYFSYINYYYINCERTHDLRDILACIHEYSHIITAKISSNNLSLPYQLNELLPLLMEVLALQYINDQYEGFEEDSLTYIKSLVDNMIIYCDEIIASKFFFQNIQTPLEKKVAITNLKKLLGINFCKYNKLFERLNYERFVYSVPFLLVIELSFLFGVDPQKTLYHIDKLIHFEDGQRLKYKLEKMSININEHSESFLSLIKKRSINL